MPDLNPALPYADLAIIAIKRDLAPASRDDALTQYFVTKCGHDETTAQYAVAGQRYTEARSVPVTPYQQRVMRNIDRARYHRVTGGFRALPVMGKPMPLITLKTAVPLIHARYVEQDGITLRLTKQGKNVAYD